MSPLPTRRNEGREIASRSTRHEHPTRLRRQAGKISYPAKRFILCVDRASTFLPRPTEDVRCRCCDVEQPCGFGRRSRTYEKYRG